MSGLGNNPAQTVWVGLLGGSRRRPRPLGRFQPEPKPGYLEQLLILSVDKKERDGG
jgi:hypothetical protein